MSEGKSGGGKEIIELIVVLVLVGFGLWWMKNPPENAAVNNSPTSGENGTVAGGGNTPSSGAVISYQNALAQFKDARIQLDNNCQATPNRMTFKNGSNIMIDNRSDKARTVKVGSTFTIDPWGFKIVRLVSSTLPATWYVDCGNSQNVATILIQK